MLRRVVNSAGFQMSSGKLLIITFCQTFRKLGEALSNFTKSPPHERKRQVTNVLSDQNDTILPWPERILLEVPVWEPREI